MENQSIKPKKSRKKEKAKRIIITIVVIILILAAAAYFFLPRKEARTATGPVYIESPVQRRTIQTTLSSSGTLVPADSYSVTASVSGEILECTFEEGDKVEKDDLLYVIDSSDMVNTIDRAQISYDKTLRSYNKIVESMDDLNVYSDYSGTVIDVYVEEGDEINNGAKLIQIRDSDTMNITVPFAASDARELNVGQVGSAVMEGSFETRDAVVTEIDAFESHLNGVAVKYVKLSVNNTQGGIFDVTEASVNFGEIVCLESGVFEYNKVATVNAKVSGTVQSIVKKGDRVVAGETLVCLLESETLEDNFKDAQASLDDAQLSFDNTKEKLDDYTIEAPITGTVIEKYSKTGDTLGMSSQGQSTMAIIYDLSYLKFDMSLDELDISKVAVGQKVVISCEAINLSGIEGEITKVSVVGTTSYNSTSYPVTVKVYDPPEGLLAGMNVDAELIIEESVDALAVPTAAIQRGNVVYVKDDGSKAEDDRAPEGYMSVAVKTGISNDNYIEIIEGDLEEGDTVYVPQAVNATTEDSMMGMMGMMGGNMGGMPPSMGGNMGGGMPPSMGGMSGSRPSGNMGGMSGSRPSGNFGGGMR